MRRQPLFPLLRAGAITAFLAALLLYRPKRAPETPPETSGPAVWTTDLGPEASQVVNLPPPPRPFPKQVTECKPRVHTRINGGCWRKLADGPPCEEAYLWEGACYLPVMAAQRPPTTFGR